MNHYHFQGIGLAQVVVSFSMTVYYPIIMTWCMYYLYLSFRYLLNLISDMEQ